MYGNKFEGMCICGYINEKIDKRNYEHEKKKQVKDGLHLVCELRPKN